MIKVKKYIGIVLKVTDKHIVLMCEDGVFKNVPLCKSVPRIGEKFEYKQKDWIGFSNIHYLSIASLLLFVLFSSFLLLNNNKKDAYVFAIDINPSIELYADEDLTITKVVALNSDGQKIIEGLSSENKSTNALITEILEQTVKQKYLTSANKGVVAITIVPLIDNKSKVLPDIQQMVYNALNSKGISAEIITQSTNKQTLKSAKSHDMSITKYLLYTDLETKGINVKLEDIKEQSIQQIYQLEKAFLQEDDSVKESSIDKPINNQSTIKSEEQTTPIIVENKKNRETETITNEEISTKKNASQTEDKERRSEAMTTNTLPNTVKEENAKDTAIVKNTEVENQEEIKKDLNDNEIPEQDDLKERNEEEGNKETRNEEDSSNKGAEEAPVEGKKEHSGKP